MIVKFKKPLLGVLFWVLVVVGGMMLDKGNNGTTISIYQIWGVIFIVAALVVLYLYNQFKKIDINSVEAYMKTEDFTKHYLRYLDHIQKQEFEEQKKWAKRNKF